MSNANAVIADPVGLHARPAADFVRTANKFSSAITVMCEGKSANAKSIIQVISLNARQGATVTLTASGPDEEEALRTLVTLLEAPGAGS